MTRIRSAAGAILLAAAFLTACDDARPGRSATGDDDAVARAEYARELIFIATDATGAALLDFAAVDLGSTVRRSARGWAEAGSGWTPLYDLTWQSQAVRRPWRLVPHGPIRLRVALNDEIDAIHVRERDTNTAALEYGDFAAVWRPHATSQVVLREANFAVGAEPMTGWLIDARFGVTEAADAPDEPVPPNGVSDGGDVAAAAELAQEDSAVDTDSLLLEAITQSEPGSAPPRAPASMRVRSLRAALIGAEGEALVIGETETGLAGWFHAEGEERSLPIVTLTAVPGARESWTIEAGGGATLSGTLLVMDEEPMPLSPRIVSGTIAIAGDTLEMHGVLRPEPGAN